MQRIASFAALLLPCSPPRIILVSHGADPHEPPYEKAGWRRHRQGHEVNRVGGGVHGLRVLRFVPAQDTIEVRTWDAMVDRAITRTERVSDEAQHWFNLPYRMRGIVK